MQEKRVRDGLAKAQAIAPALQADPVRRGVVVRALAETQGKAASGIYKDLKKYRRAGVAGLMRKARADIGRKRAVVSLEFDKLCPLPAETLAGIGAELDRYVAGLWAQGVGGWKQAQQLGGLKLQELCQANGWHPNLSDCHLPRHVAERGRDYGLLAVHDNDAKGFYDRYQPDVRRDHAGLRPFGVVVGDVHPLDIGCRRPDGSVAYARLIGWYDVRTHLFVCAPILLQPKEGVRRVHIAQSFAHLCQTFSVPEALHVDNGGEYSWDEMLAGFAELSKLTGLARLEVGAKPALRDKAVIRAKPYNAKSKPIEGCFSVLETVYFSQIQGWIGGDRMTKKTQNLGKEPNPYAGTFESLCDELDVMVRRYNAEPQKALGGLSPNEALAQARAAGWRPAQVDAAALMLAFAEGDARAVKGGRLVWNGASYYDDRLLGVKGERLVKVAEHDPRLAFVFEGAGERPGKLLCAAAIEPRYGYLDKAGAEERERRIKRMREIVGGMRKYVHPLTLVEEHKKYLAAADERPADFGGALLVVLSDEARAMRAAVERQAEELNERARQTAPLLSQWAVEDDPEEIALRQLLRAAGE